MREFWLRVGEKLSFFLLAALEKHPGKLIGVLAGFLLGLFIIIFGFWHTLMLVVLVAIGLLIGKRWDEDKKLWLWINRLFD